MKEGDVVLVALPQANSQSKDRPAIVLRSMPPFGDLLVCGVSRQLHQQTPGFDKFISRQDADFAGSGLRTSSLIRLGFLAMFSRGQIFAVIGEVSTQRHQRLLRSLADYLVSLEKAP